MMIIVYMVLAWLACAVLWRLFTNPIETIEYRDLIIYITLEDTTCNLSNID